MKKLCTIGEALLDFVPVEKGRKLKDVVSFKRVVGGAPVNVAGAVAKLGGSSKVFTQVGNDAFGDHIIETLAGCNIDVSNITQSDDYETSLAFVSLSDDGDRDFKFYRKNAADLYFDQSNIKEGALADCGVLHFCSVDLVDSLMRKSHDKLIRMAIDRNVFISFDPNLRLSLWDKEDELKETVNDYIEYADILKIADDELEFIFGCDSIDEVLPQLFAGRCKLLIYTKGKNGAEIYTKDFKVSSEGYTVEAVDATGAGDSFIGALLYRILKSEKDLEEYTSEELTEYLDFANLYAAYTVTQIGALSAMATHETLEDFKSKL